MRKLPPAIPGSAEDLAITVVAGVILQQSHVGGGLGVNGIVQAKDLVGPRPGERIYELRVVLALPSGIGGVGQREQVYHRWSGRVKPPGGNLVALERHSCGGMLDDNQRARRGERLGKVALPLESGGHGITVGAGHSGIVQVIVREEPKQPRAALVKPSARDDERTADRAAGILVAI